MTFSPRLSVHWILLRPRRYDGRVRQSDFSSRLSHVRARAVPEIRKGTGCHSLAHPAAAATAGVFLSLGVAPERHSNEHRGRSSQ